MGGILHCAESVCDMSGVVGWSIILRGDLLVYARSDWGGYYPVRRSRRVFSDCAEMILSCAEIVRDMGGMCGMYPSHSDSDQNKCELFGKC